MFKSFKVSSFIIGYSQFVFSFFSSATFSWCLENIKILLLFRSGVLSELPYIYWQKLPL